MAGLLALVDLRDPDGCRLRPDKSALAGWFDDVDVDGHRALDRTALGQLVTHIAVKVG